MSTSRQTNGCSSRTVLFTCVLLFAAVYLLYGLLLSCPITLQDDPVHTAGAPVAATAGAHNAYVDVPLNIHNDRAVANIRTILWFNPPGWIQPWNALINCNDCLYSNCDLVTDKELFAKSDAVIFSIGDKKFGPKPPVSPDKRNTRQVWTFFSLESPAHVYYPDDYKRPLWRNVFNWLWTYRQDLDIFQPYGILETKNKIPARNYTQVFQNKTRFAAWLVSHCQTHGERENYVKLLQKYVSVYVFGKCRQKNVRNVEELVNTKYKFYLGFENSICDDYITEKFFHYYRYDLITVVRGRVNYNKYLPNGSFINTSHFPTLKSLADFLIRLGANETEYSKYLASKYSNSVYDCVFTYRNSMCKVCEKLNKLDENTNLYPDIAEWLGHCYKANDIK